MAGPLQSGTGRRAGEDQDAEHGVGLAPGPTQNHSVSAFHPWGLLALTAPEEPPIFSSSRKDNLESSWAGLAGGGRGLGMPLTLEPVILLDGLDLGSPPTKQLWPRSLSLAF